MATRRINPTQALTDKLRQDLERVLADVREIELTARGRSALSEELQKSASLLNGLLAEIDPIDRPTAIFDPGNPLTVGFFVALAMTAQPRKPLADLRGFYGAGVYALYYNGDFEPYKAISSTETPIYVGMALQGAYDKHELLTQGTPLTARLTEHRKNIERATETLKVADFSYRSLVVRSGWERPAEDYLIKLFRPLWNRETNILYGFGKHGDSSNTRKNKRSPWDTLHAGRKWAIGDHQLDAKSPEEILRAVSTHFEKTRVFTTFETVIQAFIADLMQS